MTVNFYLAVSREIDEIRISHLVSLSDYAASAAVVNVSWVPSAYSNYHSLDFRTDLYILSHTCKYPTSYISVEVHVGLVVIVKIYVW